MNYSSIIREISPLPLSWSLSSTQLRRQEGSSAAFISSGEYLIHPGRDEMVELIFQVKRGHHIMPTALRFNARYPLNIGVPVFPDPETPDAWDGKVRVKVPVRALHMAKGFVLEVTGRLYYQATESMGSYYTRKLDFVIAIKVD